MRVVLSFSPKLLIMKLIYLGMTGIGHEKVHTIPKMLICPLMLYTLS